jgi:hypothetical protein
LFAAGGVGETRGVVKERLVAGGCVVVAGCGGEERGGSVGGIKASTGIGVERLLASGGVRPTAAVDGEGKRSGCRVVVARSVGKKRTDADARIVRAGSGYISFK